MEKIRQIAQTILYVIGAILALTIIAIPYFLGYQYLKKNGKRIVIYPKFKIVDVKNKDKVEPNAVKDSVRIGTEILKKIKSIRRSHV